MYQTNVLYKQQVSGRVLQGKCFCILLWSVFAFTL